MTLCGYSMQLFFLVDACNLTSGKNSEGPFVFPGSFREGHGHRGHRGLSSGEPLQEARPVRSNQFPAGFLEVYGIARGTILV